MDIKSILGTTEILQSASRTGLAKWPDWQILSGRLFRLHDLHLETVNHAHTTALTAVNAADNVKYHTLLAASVSGSRTATEAAPTQVSDRPSKSLVIILRGRHGNPQAVARDLSRGSRYDIQWPNGNALLGST